VDKDNKMKYVLVMVFVAGSNRNVETLVVDFDTKTQCNIVLDKVRSSLNSNAVILSSGCYKK
jgi:hypothetical protein